LDTWQCPPVTKPRLTPQEQAGASRSPGGYAACLIGFLGCGHGKGPEGHGVVDGPDADRVGLIPAGGGHALKHHRTTRSARPAPTPPTLMKPRRRLRVRQSGHLSLRPCPASAQAGCDRVHATASGLDSAGESSPLGPTGGPGRVLAGTGRTPARVRGSAILPPGAPTTGPGPCRAMRPHPGHGQRRALDRRQNGGQLLAGSLRGLALFVLFLGSGGSSSQPLAHRAQPANLRPRHDDAIHRVEHQQHDDETTNHQADHQHPALA
jgi:hypothetical protein